MRMNDFSIEQLKIGRACALSTIKTFVYLALGACALFIARKSCFEITAILVSMLLATHLIIMIIAYISTKKELARREANK